MLGWMVLIRNLMQIFPTTPPNPQCYCTCWRRFSGCCFHARLPETIPPVGDRCCGAPVGHVPRCPENACPWPYNQRLEGLRPSPPKRALLISFTSEYE